MTDRGRAAAVLTVSDGVAAGTREDLSGELAVSELEALGFEIVARETVPDDEARIAARVRSWAEEGRVRLVLSTGGTGLGLIIVKHLVNGVGGRVWVEAAAEGGSRFTVLLPRPGASRDRPSATRDAQVTPPRPPTKY